MADMSPLAKKIGLKPAMSALLVGAPDGVAALLEPLPAGAGVALEPTATPADVVLLFAVDAAALEASFPIAQASAKDGALLWIAYPKGGKKAGTDLNRDILWEHMKPYGLTGVTLVAVDATWSAMRFRPTEEVGT
jgi:hypothetical protein